MWCPRHANMLLNDNKISKGSMQVSVKDAQVPLQKNNYMGKEWEKEPRMGKCLHWKWDATLKI